MNNDNNRLKQALFYDVPPPSPNHKFYTELIEKGNFNWGQWNAGAIYRAAERHTKYREITWPEFILIGSKWRMKAQILWNDKQFDSSRLQLWVEPLSKEMPGEFRATFAFCLWNPEDDTQHIMRQITLDNFETRKGRMQGFSNFVAVLANQCLPKTNKRLFDHGGQTNLTLYIRLEVSKQKIYPLQPPDPRIAQHFTQESGIGFQMVRQGNDYQDSTEFECEGARWRLFYSPKPPKLLLQRMPGDNVGTIAVNFDLIGWYKDKKYKVDYLEHEFEPGFNDWGMDHDFYKKCTVFAIRMDAERYAEDVVNPTPAYVNAAPPPGPPPSTHSSTAEIPSNNRQSKIEVGPPAGPPPGHNNQQDHTEPRKEDPPAYF